jgi:hypothetical protein
VATCLGIVGSKKGGMEERKLFRYFWKQTILTLPYNLNHYRNQPLYMFLLDCCSLIVWNFVWENDYTYD